MFHLFFVFLFITAGSPLWRPHILALAPFAEYIWKLTRSTKKLLNSNSLGIELTNNLNKYERAEPLREGMPCNSNRTWGLTYKVADVYYVRLVCASARCRFQHGPCLLLLCCQMEPCACISRVLMKGCKCLEAAWSVPQYDLRLTQSIGL